MRFRFIEDRRADSPVTIMCEVLAVSPAGCYAWRSRPESRRSAANRELVDDIKRIHRDTSGRYGSRRIHAELKAQGRGEPRSYRKIDAPSRYQGRHDAATAVCGPPTAVMTSRSPEPARPQLHRHCRRTGSGLLISPTSRPIRAGSIWPRSWISTVERSSAGQCAIICAPTCRWQPCGWPSRRSGPVQA